MAISEEMLIRKLEETETIAIVGLSDKVGKASCRVGFYLQKNGYKIIPVNPGCEEVLGERCYPSLRNIPHKVDLVLVFRRGEETPAIAEQALAVGAKFIWLQEGISNPQTERIAKEGGLDVVMDRCIMKAHQENKEKMVKNLDEKEYEIVIVGGGPAGLTSALYASRSGNQVVVLEAGLPGGYVNNTAVVENYPGFPQPLSGAELGELFVRHAETYGAEIRRNIIVKKIKKAGGKFLVETSEENLLARAVIIATGAKPRKLGIPGEEEFIGRGVSYCATCDGPLFRNKIVAVVGGGNSALEESNMLTKIVDEVHLIHRREKFRGDAVYQDRVKGNPKIVLEMSSLPTKIIGEQVVQGIEVERANTSQREIIPVNGVFIYVGHRPVSDFVKGLVEMDSAGYIKTDGEMLTSQPGVFAAGDVRAKSLKQISTAVGDGAVAAFSAHRYLEGD